MAITTKTKEQLTNEIILKLIENGVVTDFNIGSVLRTIIEGIVDAIGSNGDADSLYNQVIEVYDNSRIDSAEGDALGQIGSLVGVNRDLGSSSSGQVTFIRNSDLNENLLIEEGFEVGTSPGEGDQKTFVVQEDTNFNSEIEDETITFYDGIYYYPLSARFFETISSLQATVSSSTQILTEDTDFQISDYDNYYVDTSKTIVEVDTFDANNGWTQNEGETLSVDSSDYKEGTGSLNLLSTSGTNDYFYIEKTLGSALDISGKSPVIYFYVEDTTTLNKLSSIDIYTGNTNISNSVKYSIDSSNITTGWNKYFVFEKEFLGVPNLEEIDYIRIRGNLLNSTDTITDGNIKVDYFIFNEVSYHEGKVIEFLSSGTNPDDETDISVTYNPRSVDVICTSSEIGSDKNVAKGKITNKITVNSVMNQITSIYNYESFSGGTDKQSDVDYRSEIKSAASSTGYATAEALKGSIERISGVRSVFVNDLPTLTITNEPHVYNTNVDTYKLNNEVVYLDDETTPTNISITDTFDGSADYTYTDDYTMSNSSIVWTGTGSTPTDGATFFTNYSTKWLGHCNIIVAGDTSFTTSQKNEIDEVIENTKPAGASVTWEEPSIVYISVTTTITLESGFTLTDAKETEIELAINDYINSLGIGEDVIKNKILAAIISIEGIQDASISAPASDTTINSDEIARSGSLNISTS